MVYGCRKTSTSGIRKKDNTPDVIDGGRIQPHSHQQRDITSNNIYNCTSTTKSQCSSVHRRQQQHHDEDPVLFSSSLTAATPRRRPSALQFIADSSNATTKTQCSSISLPTAATPRRRPSALQFIADSSNATTKTQCSSVHCRQQQHHDEDQVLFSSSTTAATPRRRPSALQFHRR